MHAVGNVFLCRAATAVLPILCVLACGEASEASPQSNGASPIGPGSSSTNAGGMIAQSTPPGGAISAGGATANGGVSGGLEATGGSVAAGAAGGGSPPVTGTGGSTVGAGGSSDSDLGTTGGIGRSDGDLGTTGGVGGAAGVGGAGEGSSAESGGMAGQTDWMAGADAKELIKSGNPGNAKLAAYADGDIGSPVIGLEGTGTSRDHTACVVVPPGVIYDGKGEKLTAKGLGNGSQDEGQIPYFILMPGAGIKNVTIGVPGTEGIHMMGNNTLENIVWEDVGEDAASVRSYFPGGYIYVEGGSVNSAADKTFQLNAPAKIIIKNFKATNISKLVRQGDLLQGQPGGEVPIEVVLDNVTASNVKTALVMCNDMDCTLMTRDVSGSPLTSGGVERLDWVEGASDRPTQ